MKIRVNVYLVLLAVVFTSCQDVFENDLSSKTINIVAPADSSTIVTGEIPFWWDYIDIEGNYKEEYNLLVVSPSFDNIHKLLLDTTIASNRFNFILEPGNYQCWVFALNGSTYSDTTIHTFTITDTTTVGR